jgi:hypothetical protein
MEWSTLKALMRNWLLLLISAAALALAPATVAAQASVPERLEIVYELSRDGSVLADITEELHHGGGKYEIAETWKGRGLYALAGKVRRTSRGMVGPKGLRPVEFSDERTGRSDSRASFDWNSKTLTVQYKHGPKTLPLPDDAQDRLSFMLAFAFMPPGLQSVSFSVADGKGLTRYVFDRQGSERVSTPAGWFDAVKWVRRKDDPNDRRSTELWLSPAKGRIPVRVLLTSKDGSRIDQRLSRISPP